MAIPAYSSNMSLINPADLNVMNTGMGGMYGSAMPGMNNELMGLAKALPNQAATQPTGMSEMDMYRMASGALQGMGRNMQMQMPSGNTAQIIRDNNQFRYAGNPQQQMAMALRQRGQ